MYTVKFLISLVEHHQTLTYVIIFLGLIFEGEVIVISTGVLSHLGAINLGVAIGVILGGALIKIFGGYYLGGLLSKKYSYHKFFQYVEKKVSTLMPHFNQKPFWSIFLSKFIMGTNYIVIIFSGYQKINIKTFIKAEFISTTIWIALMLSIGYFFSYTALHVSHEVWRFTLIILLLVVLFLVLDKLISWIYELYEELHAK